MAQWPLQQWSIRQKALVGFAAAVTVLMIVVGAAYFTTESFRRSSRQIEQSLQIIAAQQAVSPALFDLAWNQRTFIVTAAAADLQARNESLATLQSAMTQLRALTDLMTGEQRQRMQAAEQTIDSEIELMDIALLVRQGKREITPEQLEAVRVQARAKLIAARELLTAIDNDEKQRVAQHIAATQRASAALYISLACATIVFVLGIGWLVLRILADLKAQDALELRLQDSNKELQHKTEQLTLANSELESFSYSVSHDLRAPLRAIDGYSGLLEQDHRAQLSGEALRYLSGIRNNSQRMAELIDDLLKFSRLGRLELELTHVDMTGIAKQAAKEAVGGNAARLPDIAIEPLADTQCDPRALHQVWLNLLDNAVKYSSHNAAPKITVWAEQRNSEVVYSVRDNGVGFDMQYQDKLFGVFERLHSSKDYPGTGVGLAIVHRVITRHGGRVWAESAPGQGAVFHFSLPLASQP